MGAGESSGAASALFADLYELKMFAAYRAAGLEEAAVFSLYVRELPRNRNFLLACGLEDFLDELETLRFEPRDIDYLRSLNVIPDEALLALADFRFQGDVYAAPEGTPLFPGEPILEIVAPAAEAQLLETLALNQIGLQTLLASKAARVVAAAAGRPVVDFGARRAQGLDAAVKGARAFAVAGVAATSLLAAGARYGLPVAGTMAHSFVQAFDSESEAFAAFASLYPSTVLLVDTYDTLQGVRHAIDLAGRLGDDCRLTGVRLDSGDLAALSRDARALLDAAGLQRLKIVASGGLDESRIAALVRSGAPIDMFGVGTDMSVSADAPALDIAYKLTEYAGRGRMKLSPRKATTPGRKQVFRREADGIAVGDTIARFDEALAGTPLLAPAMIAGRRVGAGATDISALARRAAAGVACLPTELRALEPARSPFQVGLSERLAAEADALARSLRRREDLSP
jgi:nicotinate phosphoribosyltransferase